MKPKFEFLDCLTLEEPVGTEMHAFSFFNASLNVLFYS